MRRLVLVLFALALLCQGAWAAMAPSCGFGGCCGAEAAVPADTAVHPGGGTAHDDNAHAPCDAASTPCADEGCNCHGPGLTGLLIELPTLPAAAPGAVGASVCLRHRPDHIPDSALRPPHTHAA